MNQAYKMAFACGLLITALVACRTKITPLLPPADPVETEPICKAPPIEKNVLGSWKGGIALSLLRDTIARSAPMSQATFMRLGTITFGRDKTITDPDSLLENYFVDTGPVIGKTYSIETDTVKNSAYRNFGELFWIRLRSKPKAGISGFTGYYFKVIANECNRVHLKGPSGAYELVLVR